MCAIDEQSERVPRLHPRQRPARHRLVYVETFATALEAIAREKQLKNWQRRWKIRLIEENNLDWDDLSHLL
jgi:predicted GIY-YIG superfamily endonuclease